MNLSQKTFTFALFRTNGITRSTLPNLQDTYTSQCKNKNYLTTPPTANCCSEANVCHKSYGQSYKALHWEAQEETQGTRVVSGCQCFALQQHETSELMYSAFTMYLPWAINNGTVPSVHKLNISTLTLHHLHISTLHMQTKKRHFDLYDLCFQHRQFYLTITWGKAMLKQLLYWHKWDIRTQMFLF